MLRLSDRDAKRRLAQNEESKVYGKDVERHSGAELLERARELASFGYDRQAREILERLVAERGAASLSVEALAVLAEQLAKVGSLDAAQGVGDTLADRVEGGASVTGEEIERAGL